MCGHTKTNRYSDKGQSRSNPLSIADVLSLRYELSYMFDYENKPLSVKKYGKVPKEGEAYGRAKSSIQLT